MAGEAKAALEQPGAENWGLGGAVKAGTWAPLYVELRSTGEDFRGLLMVEARGQGRVLPVSVKPLELVQGTDARHWVYVRVPRDPSGLASWRFGWRVIDERGREAFATRWPNPVVLDGAKIVVAALDTPGLGAAGLNTLIRRQNDDRVSVVRVPPAFAPDRAIGYEAADVLVWVNPDPTQLVALAQAEAIVNYVRQGGHLVLATGDKWPLMAKSFLADLLPATPMGSRAVAELPALAIYGGAADVTGRPTVLVDLEQPRGEALMKHDDRPVIVRGACGFGRVTLVGFDPTGAPFSGLGVGRERFWTQILDLDPERRPLDTVATGVADPLVRSLNEFPGFRPISFFFVMAFLVAYVVVIGPIDYVVLKRMGKLHWTWVTFPSVALISSLIAFLLLSTGQGLGLMTNSLAVVDAAVDQDEVTGTTLTTVLSPRHARFSVSLEEATAGWIAPRDYSRRGASMSLAGSTCYVLEQGARIEGLRVQVWEAQTLEAGWRAPAPDLPEAQLTWDGRIRSLAGSIRNDTPDTLDGVVLLHGGRARRLGVISPGRSVGLGGARDAQPMSAYADAMCPELFRGGKGFMDYGWREPSVDRNEAESAARWISLFGAMAGPLGGGLRRDRPGTENTSAIAFDLPSHLQLTGLDTVGEAVVLYTVNRSFVRIGLGGRRPKSWERTLVRLRVPVASTRRAEGETP